MPSEFSTCRSLAVLIFVACVSVVTALGQDTAFTTPAGQQMTVSSMQGKVAVMIFSGTQDPQCGDEFKVLNNLGERYNGKPVIFCWVSINPASAVTNDRLKAPCGPVGSVIVLRDPSQAAFKRFSKTQSQIPVLVIADQKGQTHGEPI